MEGPVALFAELMIYLIILFLTLYGVALGYHWYSYGDSKATSTTTMTIYVAGSIALVLALVTAFNFLQ